MHINAYVNKVLLYQNIQTKKKIHRIMHINAYVGKLLSHQNMNKRITFSFESSNNFLYTVGLYFIYSI